MLINRLLIKKCKLVKLQEQKKALANPSNLLWLSEYIINISLRISIPGNVSKYSGECRKTFRGMSPNIPGNVAKHSGEYHQRFRGIPTTPIRPITLALLMNYYLRISLLGFITVTYKNFAIEIFKVKLGIAPDIMKNVFPIIENPYDLRNKTKFKSRNVSTVRYGIETAYFVAPRIWSSIPQSYKECSSVKEFKAKIKCWYPEYCPCKLCKNYIC